MDFVSRTQHTRSLRRKAPPFENFACRRRLCGAERRLKKVVAAEGDFAARDVVFRKNLAAEGGLREAPPFENFLPPKANF